MEMLELLNPNPSTNPNPNPGHSSVYNHDHYRVREELQASSTVFSKSVDILGFELKIMKNIVKLCDRKKNSASASFDRDRDSDIVSGMSGDSGNVEPNTTDTGTTATDTMDVAGAVAGEQHDDAMEVEGDNITAVATTSTTSTSTTNSNIDKPDRPDDTLGKILAISQYAATSIILRTLFLQALYTTRTLYTANSINSNGSGSGINININKTMEVGFHEEISLKHLYLKIYDDFLSQTDRTYASSLKLKFWRDLNMKYVYVYVYILYLLYLLCILCILCIYINVFISIYLSPYTVGMHFAMLW